MSEEVQQVERELRELALPSGAVAKLVTYLTGREARRIDRAFYESIKLDPGEQVGGRMITAPTPTVSVAQCQQEKDDELIKCVVVELNGSRDNVFERVLDLRATDWEVIVAETK